MRAGIQRRAKNSSAAIALLALWPVDAASAAPTESPPDYERLVAEQPHMGSLVRITAYAPKGVDGVRALQAAFARVRELSRIFSDYHQDSELNRVSRQAAHGSIVISSDLFSILRKSTEISAKSDGAFDVTSGALTRLHRRSRERGISPTPAELEKARLRVGWQSIVLDPANRSVFFQKQGIQLDLGGIAKGYIADQALAALRSQGVGRALVAIAGDIAAGDPPPGELGWRVNIDATGIERQVTLANQAVSTSGDRERSYEVAGLLYSHIIDPASNRVARPPRAVSVIAASGAEADAWATALHILGPPGPPEIKIMWFDD